MPSAISALGGWFLTITPKGERTEGRCIPRWIHCRAVVLAEADPTRVDADETLADTVLG